VIALCKLDDIPSGRSLGVLPDARGRDQILIVRKDGEVFGYRNSCPHYDRARLGWKKNEFLNGDRTMIMCAAHGALFRIQDGVCEIGPCVGAALRKVALTIAEDRVYLVNEHAGLLAK